ncbi:MAG: ATP-binding protein [Vicinamibacterales bacterium]|jgi:signal transduction histidine kinase
MGWRLRLHYRIVIPFAVVALVATSASAFLALLVVSRAFEARIQSQILNTADVISRGGFAFNPAILRSVKAITGADVVAFDDGGAVLSTTIDPARDRLIRTVTSGEDARAARAAGVAGLVHALDCDAPCYAAYRPVSDRPGVLVAVIVETTEAAAAIRTVARTILLTALTSLAGLVLISQVVARRVTAPLEQLVTFTHNVAGGGRGRARAGTDEVGRLGQAFNEMLDQLDASQSALVRSEKLALAGLLAARVAHDIRNPLASMKIQAQLLESRVKGDARSGTLVGAVLDDISQLESVIRDLIELARPGEIRRMPADLNALIRTVLRQLDARLLHRKVAVQLDLPARLPLVNIDPERLSQALLNVISNAGDAMPNGGVLDIRTRATGDHVVIEIDDDGEGIDPEIMDRVFDPFVSSKPGGVGLGLVNAKAVVESHGGRIALTPRQPRGTRAMMTLPLGASNHG